MITRIVTLVAAMTAVAAAGPKRTTPPAIVAIEAGIYRPAFPASPGEAEVPVGAFRIDRTPVTNAQFLAFVKSHPEWRRDRVKRLVADASYLAHWQSPDELGEARPQGPVVRVSWFAARAYCEWKGGRLPEEKEWELAAYESDDKPLLAWYAELTPRILPDVGRRTNARGVADMHGLVWEWIEDFNAALVSADSRAGKREMFCGGAAASATNPSAYATFMRLAFRASLEARYTTALLGFRCAYGEITP